MISHAFSWWIDGLAAGFLSFERRLRPQRRFQLRADDRPFLLRGLDRKNQSFTASIDTLDGQAEQLAPDVLEKTKGSEIEIVVPDTAVLENQLKPLPEESRPYIDNVVRHRIEALFPWRAEDTLFAADVTDCADGQLAVKVRATPRGAVALALNVAMACGAREVNIIRDSEQNSGSDKVIPAFERPGNRRFERARSAARYAVIGLTVFAAATIGNSILTRMDLKADISGLDQTISDRQAVLQLRQDRETTFGALESKKKGSAITVLLLEELSKILPDDTYLTDLTLDAGRLRITGTSARAADLIPLLEGTGHFKNAVFYAPTTRQTEGLDHFSIETSVITNISNE
jgi:general secretion pathway protein L